MIVNKHRLALSIALEMPQNQMPRFELINANCMVMMVGSYASLSVRLS